MSDAMKDCGGLTVAFCWLPDSCNPRGLSCVFRAPLLMALLYAFVAVVGSFVLTKVPTVMVPDCNSCLPLQI